MVRKEELKYIERVFEEPDGYIHYKRFSEYVNIYMFNKIPDEDWWNEVIYCERPTVDGGSFSLCFFGAEPSLIKNKKGVTVCQCVWEMTGKNTHGALVYYLREVIKAGGVMPVDVKIEDGKVTDLDGSHRVIAHIQLGNEMIPVYINREKHHWATCWRPGMILEDGTLNMSYDLSLEIIVE